MGNLQTASLDHRLRATAVRRIRSVLADPKGLPNGKGGRTKLPRNALRLFESTLMDVVEHAHVWASHGPLPNRVQRRGRPPDNAVLVFIDDIMRACRAAGLKPGLRYVAGSESLPVRLYQELAPLLWPYSGKAARRVFQRWQRHDPGLVRS